MAFLKTKLKFINTFRLYVKHARWYHWLTIPWCIGALTIVHLTKAAARWFLRSTRVTPS